MKESTDTKANGAAPHLLLEQLAQEQLDDEENARILEQEREIEEESDEEPQDTHVEIPCPDAIWRGPFAQVAEVARQRSWEVWMGTFAAIAALSRRSIMVRYHGRLSTNVYCLLIKPTGKGKRLVTDICEGLLPEYYRKAGTVSSGPALGPVLADIEREKGGRIINITSYPVILIIQEWTSLVKYLNIQHASLSEDLNKIFDCPLYHNISRSDREKTGGNMQIPQPTLSILGTTSDKLFTHHVTEQMLYGGFLNRYLILPGSSTAWKLYDEDQAGLDLDKLPGLMALPLAPHDVFSQNPTLKECYATEAWEWFYAWGLEFFEHGIMTGSAKDVPMTERLHVYFHKIALLYAWAEHAQQVEIEHVEAAKLVIEASYAYLRALAEEGADITIPPAQKYEVDIDNRIRELVRDRPGQLDVSTLYKNHLRKTATYAKIKAAVSAGIEAGNYHFAAKKLLAGKARRA